MIAREDFYFVYPTNYNEYNLKFQNTFQHGGITMEEMIVPVATLQTQRVDDSTQRYQSNSEGETIDIAQQFAAASKAGTLILLYGELGAGKTLFTRGVVSYFDATVIGNLADVFAGECVSDAYRRSTTLISIVFRAMPT